MRVQPFSVRYPNGSQYVAAARRSVESFAQTCGFSADEAQDIGLAVGEALANAVEHGHRQGTFFSVRCTLSEDELLIEVEDDGPGFDPADVGGERRDDVTRGFGMTIMRSLVDGVSYSRNGRRVRLKKSIRLPETSAGGADRSLGENGN